VSGSIKTAMVCVAITLSIVVFARAVDEKAVEKEMAFLQGEWTMESGVADGYPMPEDMRRNCKRVCKGNEVTVTNGDQVVLKAKIVIDPTKTPKTIDYEMTGGMTVGKKQLGLYELDGDTLKACFGAPDGPRPSDYESKPGQMRTSTVWKRVKE
jgi:uncharacterized protein (TIGR03067 family)